MHPPTAEQQVPACTEQMWQLHAMVWQQQPSKAVVQRLAGTDARPICPAAEEALLQVLNSAVCQAAPPSTQYTARLVKQLISAAEQQQQELSEPLLELHTALLMLGSSEAAMQEEASWRYKTFYYSSSPSWRELQQLQAQQCRSIAAAAGRTASAVLSKVPAEPTDEPAAAGPTAVRPEPQELPPAAAAAGDYAAAAPGGAGPTAAKGTTGWTMPAQFQQRLTQRQQFMGQLLSAVQHWHQPGSGSDAAGAYAPGCSSSGQHTEVSCGSSSSGLITVHSSDNLFEGGTGCHMWDAGFLLAEFVLNNPQIFADRHVLEIGCGPGLVATCLRRSGASRVLLTDGDPQTLVNCLTNLSVNGHQDGMLLGSWREAAGFVWGQEEPRDSGHAQHQVQACPVDWHEDVPGLCADVIVGSDICYDPNAVPGLVRLLQQLLSVTQTALARGPPVAYISTTKRQGSTLQLFLDACAAAGLLVEEVPKQPEAWGRAAVAAAVGVLTPVTFQELPALQEGEGRDRYVLHKVTGVTT